MKNKIAKLIDVKSIITITLTIVVAILTLKGNFEIKEIYLMIIAFYFGTQSVKKDGGSNEKQDNIEG